VLTPLDPARVVYRWDLDKTYLRTEFDSIRDLLRTAVEPATRKRTVPGASVLLRELRATDPAAVFILSGSPEQMRRVLEAKLRLDGIRWDSFTLKPSLDNLMKGRFRVIKDQVSYKLEALLAARVHGERDHGEILFGDDAEADAFIYSLYADLCAGRVDNRQLDGGAGRRARVSREHRPDRAHGGPGAARGLRAPHLHPPRPRVVAGHVRGLRAARVPVLQLLPARAGAGGGRPPGPLACLRVGAGILLQQGFHPSTLNASFAELASKRAIGSGCATQLAATRAAVTPNVFAGATAGLLRFLDSVEVRLAELGPRSLPTRWTSTTWRSSGGTASAPTPPSAAPAGARPRFG
jgi:hypothetical protein